MPRARSTGTSILGFLAVLLLPIGAPSLRADLLLFYTFDDDSDPAVAVDESGQGNDGDIIAAVYTDPGLGRTGVDDDRALDFLTTAAGSYITVPSATANAFDSITLNDAATVTMWILGGDNQPVNQWNFWFGPGRQIASHVPWSDGTIYFDVAGCCAGNQRLQKSEPDSTKWKGEWNHYAFVKDADVTRIYQNGVLWAEGGGKSPLGFITEVFFGAGDSNHSSNYSGLLDDIGVWDQALSEEEILDVMENGVGPPRPVSIRRDIPDALVNGTSGVVTIAVLVRIPGSTVVINEKMPAGLTASSPSNNGALAGDTITWDLGKVDSDIVVSYAMTASLDASDAKMPSTATVDGAPAGIGGDTSYTGSSFTSKSFIRLWNHLGPLAWQFPSRGGDHGPPGACDTMALDPGDPTINIPNLGRDWIVNEAGTVTEANILPFPGMMVQPQYGGDGQPGGTGARAAGLAVEAGDTGKVVRDRFPVWHGSLTRSDSMDHASREVNGFDAEDHVTISSVYITNHTGAPIETMAGFGSDDSIQILLNDVDLTLDPFLGVGGLIVCRGMGGANQEQNIVPVTIPEGESRLLVKVSDGCCQSGFRLRFHDPEDPDPTDQDIPGLQAPKLTASLESARNPRPGSVERSLAKAAYKLGEKVTVSLAASMNAAADIFIREVLPAKGLASGISDGGTQVGNAVEWNFNGVTQKTVSYDLGAEVCAGDLVFLSGQSFFRAGSNEVAVTGAATVSRQYSDDPLGQWLSRDIGATGGSAEKRGDREALVTGTGDGIRLTADSFRFVNVAKNGDFEFSARIDCMDDPVGRGLAGLMARSADDAGAANVFVALSSQLPGAGGVGTIKGTFRSANGKSTSNLIPTTADRDVAAFPLYLKIVRAGTNLSFLRSANGVAYAELVTKVIGTGTGQIQFGADVLAGLAVTSVGGGSTRADFAEVSPPFTAVPPDPPAAALASTGAAKGEIALSWTAPAAGPPPTSYTVHRAAAPGGPYAQAIELPAEQTTHVDTGLADDTQFCYVVRSKAATGESGNSNESCAKTQPAGVLFRRGDANGDGALDLSDPIGVLGFQFLGGAAPACFDAADVDDVGATLDLTDGIYSLQYQFLGGPPPPNPGPNCGLDPTPDPFPPCVYTKC